MGSSGKEDRTDVMYNTPRDGGGVEEEEGQPVGGIGELDEPRERSREVGEGAPNREMSSYRSCLG